MLTQIKLTNFKRFTEETTFPLSNFNLLTGVNGSGKSTLLQVLLLINQKFNLNGHLVELGNPNDVISMRGKPICFEFEYECSISDWEEDEDWWTLIQKIRYELFPSIDGLLIEKIILNPYSDVKDSTPMIFFRSRDEEGNDCYRTDDEGYSIYKSSLESLFGGPVDSLDEIFYLHGLYPVNKLFEDTMGNDYPEYVFDELDMIRSTLFIPASRIGLEKRIVNTLYTHDKCTNAHIKYEKEKEYSNEEVVKRIIDEERVSEGLCIGFKQNNTLSDQTEAWLGKILTPLKINVQSLSEDRLELTFGGLKPVNVGFGYSSILPIIVSGLIAKPGERLIVENPEIHLHPKAQSALTQFLIQVAKTGVQVFVESHSDHVLNAVRVAVKEEQVDKEDVSILFHHSQEAKVTPIKVDKQGELSEYPADFFDEYSNQLFKLV